MINLKKDSQSISGHTEFYYPNLTYSIGHFQKELPEISKIKYVPIPNELVDQYSRMYSTIYIFS